MYCIYYTAHHNWQWLIAEAFSKLFEQKQNIKLEACKRFKDLPSNQNGKSKPKYALLRFDVTEGTALQIAFRLESEAFAFLDPKDSLYSTLSALDMKDIMPKTTLINWDFDDDADKIPSLPTQPALLKAPLGSGGFGLYFVQNSNDILELIKAHRLRAMREPGFLDKINTDYAKTHSVMAWSLQALIQPLKVVPPSEKISRTPDVKMRKSQIRAYAVYHNREIFLYKTFEVRLPTWDEDVDETLQSPTANKSAWSEEVENEYGGAGDARPYNEKRNKQLTERYVISEIEELIPAIPCLEDCVKRTLSGLKHTILSKVIQEEIGDDYSDRDERMAVVGIDLLVTESAATQCFDEDSKASASGRRESLSKYSAFVVEMNHNPAMPNPAKHHMSSKYKEHLLVLVSSLILLGLEAVEIMEDASDINSISIKSMKQQAVERFHKM